MRRFCKLFLLFEGGWRPGSTNTANGDDSAKTAECTATRNRDEFRRSAPDWGLSHLTLLIGSHAFLTGSHALLMVPIAPPLQGGQDVTWVAEHLRSPSQSVFLLEVPSPVSQSEWPKEDTLTVFVQSFRARCRKPVAKDAKCPVVPLFFCIQPT
uniref:Uncharacterized protein n=1 Tax=Eutreptiella gymnastica TaxID=73025 RepID=A0A7S4LM30_9EUGL